jgi:hypothetical protein
MASLSVALLHYPVYNIDGEVIATSVTTLDLHDIARSCMTYGVERYYFVQPIDQMMELSEQILTYWRTGPGAMWRADRREAFTTVRLVKSLEEAMENLEEEEDAEPILVATSARRFAGTVSYDKIRNLVRSPGRPILLLLGTGHGLTQEIIDACDYILRPIRGGVEYNHLSVRSALAIMLDRIVGEPDGERAESERGTEP